MEKTGSGRKRALKRKGATEEPQEAAVVKDGATESGVQPPKASAFPPGFSISEIKNKQRRHLMFSRWKQQQRKVREGRKRQSACATSCARVVGTWTGLLNLHGPGAWGSELWLIQRITLAVRVSSRSLRPAFVWASVIPFLTSFLPGGLWLRTKQFSLLLSQ